MNDIVRAIGQIGDPRFRGVLLMGVGLSLGLLIAFSVVFVWFVQWMVGPSISLPWVGEITWLDNIAGYAAIPFTLLASVFLMVPVASAFTGLFLDRIAQAVEEKHYPGLGPARPVPLSEALGETFKFLGLVIGVNLLALIAYLILAPFALFIFWGVNGFLLGREYAQMVAARRLPGPDAIAFRRRHRGAIWGTGVLMAMPLSIPVLNLLVPVIGVAAFTHLFHRLK
jgi:uncharacterized protein involved in cysteine biosynthesis